MDADMIYVCIELSVRELLTVLLLSMCFLRRICVTELWIMRMSLHVCLCFHNLCMSANETHGKRQVKRVIF